MKTPDQITPNFAPAYAAALYPDLAKIFQACGYALAVHGSMARDLDLIAVPWAEELTPPLKVIQQISDQFAIRLVGDGEARNHGRVAYTLSIGFGECAIDLSFINTSGEAAARKVHAALVRLDGIYRHDLDNLAFRPDWLRESLSLYGYEQ